MRTRLMVLYLRSRGVPYALAGLAVLLTVVMLAGWDVAWLTRIQAQVLVFATMLTAVLVVGGLGSPSPELDATVPLPWRRWRLTHALTGLLSSAAALAAVASAYYSGGAALAPVITRNVLGFGGLTAASAVVLGAGLSWTLPLTYALVAQLPLPFSVWGRVLKWPVLPGDAAPSWWAALSLCAVGIALLSARGTAFRTAH